MSIPLLLHETLKKCQTIAALIEQELPPGIVTEHARRRRFEPAAWQTLAAEYGCDGDARAEDIYYLHLRASIQLVIQQLHGLSVEVQTHGKPVDLKLARVR